MPLKKKVVSEDIAMMKEAWQTFNENYEMIITND